MSAPDDLGALRRAGTVILALGVLHTLATLGGAHAYVAAMVSSGWWRVADISNQADPMHIAVFWSLWFGALLALLGGVLRSIGGGGRPVTRPWAVAFGVVCLVGALAVPPGGFWFGALLAGWLVKRGGAG